MDIGIQQLIWDAASNGLSGGALLDSLTFLQDSTIVGKHNVMARCLQNGFSVPDVANNNANALAVRSEARLFLPKVGHMLTFITGRIPVPVQVIEVINFTKLSDILA